MDREAWRAIVHGITKNQAELSAHTHNQLFKMSAREAKSNKKTTVNDEKTFLVNLCCESISYRTQIRVFKRI